MPKIPKPLPVLRSGPVARWRRKHKLDWVGHTVLAFSEILDREGIPYLWIGDVALQELGLEFLPAGLDLLTNRGQKAIWALREIALPTGGRHQSNVLLTRHQGVLVRVWDTTTDNRHVRLSRRSGLKIASLKESLVEQRLLAEHTPSLEMEHRVKALEALHALRANPSHTTRGSGSRA